MTRPGKDIDQVTKRLLQKATVKTPSKEFTPRLMEMLEREGQAIEGASAIQPMDGKKPWGPLIFSGVCLAVFGGWGFLMLRGIFPQASHTQGVMKLLSALPANYPEMIISHIREYYLIPIVINVTSLLIILDRILRNRGKMQSY